MISLLMLDLIIVALSAVDLLGDKTVDHLSHDGNPFDS